MLDILLDTLSITRTSEALGLTQPAVSSALGRLREHFDDELLVQVGRTNIATPLADSLRQPLKDVLARTDALISKRATFDPANSARRFSFAGSDYVASTFGNEIMREVAMAGAQLAVELDRLSPGAIQRFERGEIDMLIAPAQVCLPGHPSMALVEERFVCVVSTNHPSIGRAITAEEYLAARHIVHYLGAGNRMTVLDQWFLNQSSLKRDVAVQVPSFADILEVVPGTSYVGTVPFRLADKLASRLPIRILDAPFEFPPLDIVMQWHQHLDEDAGLDWFRAIVRAVVSKL